MLINMIILLPPKQTYENENENENRFRNRGKPPVWTPENEKLKPSN